MNFYVISTYFNNKKNLEKLILKHKLKNVKKMKLDILNPKNLILMNLIIFFYFASQKY